MAIPQRVWTDKKTVRAKWDWKLMSQVYLKDWILQYQDEKGHRISAWVEPEPVVKLSNVVYADRATDEYSKHIYLFGATPEDEINDVTLEQDIETWDSRIAVWDFSSFGESENALREVFESLDAEGFENLFLKCSPNYQGEGTMISEAMFYFQSLFESTSEEGIEQASDELLEYLLGKATNFESVVDYPHTMMTDEQLVALGNSLDVQRELNLDAQGYLNQFIEEWHYQEYITREELRAKKWKSKETREVWDITEQYYTWSESTEGPSYYVQGNEFSYRTVVPEDKQDWCKPNTWYSLR